MSDANRSRLAFRRETTFGLIPSSTESSPIRSERPVRGDQFVMIVDPETANTMVVKGGPTIRVGDIVTFAERRSWWTRLLIRIGMRESIEDRRFTVVMVCPEESPGET